MYRYTGQQIKPITTRASDLGFTLLELLIGVGILALLVAVALPSYKDYVLKAKIAETIASLSNISAKVDEFYVDHKRFPNDLSEVSMDTLQDPWGHTFRYLNIALADKNQARQDRNLKPVNTDYDLYSLGPNGETHRVFTSNKGKDDIVRASNGDFLGVAGDY